MMSGSQFFYPQGRSHISGRPRSDVDAIPA